MRAKYDADTVKLSERFVKALKEVMAAEVEMMQKQNPEFADCWYWGRCTVSDLVYLDAFAFQYGSKEDMPEDGLDRFAVITL